MSAASTSRRASLRHPSNHADAQHHIARIHDQMIMMQLARHAHARRRPAGTNATVVQPFFAPRSVLSARGRINHSVGLHPPPRQGQGTVLFATCPNVCNLLKKAHAVLTASLATRPVRPKDAMNASQPWHLHIATLAYSKKLHNYG